MGLFESYFRLGFDSIVSFKEYFPILLILIIGASLGYRHVWKILLTILSFTAGILLANILVDSGLLNPNKNILKLFIPVGLLLATLFSLTEMASRQKHLFLFLTLGVGMLLGSKLAFGLQARMLLEKNHIPLLVYYNLGLGAGLAAIGFVHLIIQYLAFNPFKISHKSWNIFFSGIAIGTACLLLYQTQF